MSYVLTAARLAIITVFVVAVVSKLRSASTRVGFLESLRRMKVVPARVTAAAGWAAVCAEAVIVVLLVVPLRPVAGAGFVVAAGLLAVYSAAIARSMRRGTQTRCRCFGASGAPLGPRHIARNVALFLIAAAGVAASAVHDESTATGTVVAVAVGIFVGLLAAATDDLLDLLAPPAPAQPRRR